MLEALDGEQRREAQHRGAAVEQLGRGPEGSHGRRVGLLAQEDGHERRPREQRRGDDDQHGLVLELLEHGLSRGELGADGGDEREHAEAAVDDLGLGLEGHGLCGRGRGKRKEKEKRGRGVS